MRIYLVVLSAFLFFFSNVSAQTFEWTRNSKTSIVSTGTAIATDEQGNSYVIGSFFGSVDFDEFHLLAQGRDVFIAKYNSQGKVLWAKKAGGNFEDFGYSIALDKEGNCYIAGTYINKIVFDKDTLTAKALHDMFLAKYSSKGDLIWCRSAGGLFEDHAMTVSVDHIGNCYVAGYFRETMWFGNVSITGKPSPLYDEFLAKYDTKGNVLWAKPIGSAGYPSQNDGLAITNDTKGNVLVTGYYQTEANFDNFKLSNQGSSALYIAKFDPQGKALWAKSAGDGGTSIFGKAIASDTKNNFYVTGTFTKTAKFDSIKATAQTLAYPEIYVAKYNSDGNIIWLRTSRGFGTKTSFDVKADPENNVYAVGTFRDTARFNSFTLAGNGTENLFITKYNEKGNEEWARQVGGHGMALGKAVSVDKSSNVYVTGNFSDTAQFGKDRVIAHSGTQDAFITKLSPISLVKEKKLADVPAAEFQFLSCTIDKKSHSGIAKFSIPKPAFIQLGIYDEIGSNAEALIEGQRNGGVYEVTFDIKDLKEDDYYCRLQAGKEKQTKKIVLKK